MNATKQFFLPLIILIAMLACHDDKSINWPEKVKAGLFIPQTVRSQKYYELNGTYQTTYNASICWPGEQYIEMVYTHMSKHGWKRLAEDFLNPGLALNWARKGPITLKWGKYLQDGKDVYQWIEDWENADGDVVRYGLKYKTGRKGNMFITPETCDLEIVVIFIPGEIRQKGVEQAEAFRRAEAEKRKSPK